MSHDPELTDSINRWARDGATALDAFFPQVYDELRALARAHLDRAGQRHRPTLQPTVLVNEAYLRLNRRDVRPFANRREFFAFASRIIRHILVDHVRHRLRDKRGAGAERVSLDAVVDVADRSGGLDPLDLLELHQRSNGWKRAIHSRPESSSCASSPVSPKPRSPT